MRARTKITQTHQFTITGGPATADQLIGFLSDFPEEATVRVSTSAPDRPGEQEVTTYTVETEVISE